MSLNKNGDSNEVLAKLLDTIEFNEVIKIIKNFEDGKYTIMPYITKIKYYNDTIDTYNLTKCCRTKTLILPNCKSITDNVLMMLPYLESLTIKSGSSLTPDVFRHLNYLTKLQIISHRKQEPDNLICLKSLENLSKLEMLHVRNPSLRDEHFYHLKNLKVIVLEGNEYVTPLILNFLPKLEICIINKKLYKYVSSTKNNLIIKKIGKLDHIKIYAIKNN
jgi:hypothetical protein